ncbi:MAG: hypothetical protein V4641_05710 [Pseudomonadota bacterium]
MDLLREILGLAKDEGPAFAAWVLLLAGVAWIAGHGAKAAITNVQSLLTMNEQMRRSLADQLKTSTDGREEAERANARLRADLTSANRRMADLEGRLEFAERRAQALETELTQTMAENQRLRRISG